MSARASIRNVSAWIAPTAWLLAAASPGAAQAQANARLEPSRAITAEFASRLQTALQSAMTEGGPAAAVAVCRDLAPQIAAELSRSSGAKVARTSLRFRNPSNAPEPWQAEVLRAFDRRAAETGAPEGLEHTEVAADSSVRYMKAIPTGAVCLLCHGATLPADVEAALEQHYPHDLARGYALGDVRGAFSVTWPAAISGP